MEMTYLFVLHGKDNGENIINSIDEGPFKMGKFRETLTEGAEGALRAERDRVVADLTPKEKERYKADIRATNTLLQGLPKDIYTLINHYTDAKDIWDNVKMLLEGFELMKDDRESQLYDEFEHFLQNGRVVVQNVQGRQNRGQGNYVRGAVAAGNRGVQNRVGNANPGQAKQIKCYNYNRIGHIARNCTQAKRPHNSEYFKDKMLLMQAQENGAVLDEEQLLFITGGQTNMLDDDVDEAPVQDLALNEDNVFQSDQCDAFDSNVDEDVVGEHHEVHEMHNDVQPNYVIDSDAGYTSDSNMIMYDQYVKDNAEPVAQSNNKVVNASLTTELARYKEQVELIFEKELHSVKMQLNSTIGHNKSMREELATLKKDFKQKENKYLEDFLDMKALKEKVAIGYKNPLYLTREKQVQPALYNGHEIVKTNHVPAIVHDSEDTLEIAETNRKKMNEKMQDPMCVKKKVKIIPPEYSKENYLATFTPQTQLTPEQIFWSDDILKEKAKALKEKANDPKPITAVTVYPPNTPAKLVPMLEAEVDQNVVDRKCNEIERKNLLIVNENLIADCLSKDVFYTAINYVLTVSRFSEMHDAYTVEQARCLELEAELSKLKHKIQKMSSLEKPLDNALGNACFYTKRSQELLEYVIGTCPKEFSKRDKKIATAPLIRKKQITFKEPCETSTNTTQTNVKQQKVKKTNVLMIPSIGINYSTEASGSKPRSNTKNNRILPAKSVNKKKVEDHPRNNKSNLQQMNRVDSSISYKRFSKHMTMNRSLLKNFMKKFIGIVRFRNDHFGAIMGYGDYMIGDSMISRVYYVEGRGYNLFSVGKFCDSDLEVAFRKHSCYVRNEDGVELLKGSRGSNLYTISVEDIMKSSPICLFSKASKNKSWLWHCRLYHLNFSTINDLARKDLVRGLPWLKFEKDYLCSACQLRKIKNIFHQKSILRTPQQNSVVERRNQTLVEATRTMMIFSKAPMFQWAEGVATACYTQNRSLIHTRHNKTPYELVHDKKPDLKFLRIFGALCYPTNDNKDLGKLKATTNIGIFVGYAPNRKGYRIYNKRTR
ncbi:retrovirus-related pol polyprotein from transposon TNT 1-94 [Tanacetum coccineum]